MDKVYMFHRRLDELNGSVNHSVNHSNVCVSVHARACACVYVCVNVCVSVCLCVALKEMLKYGYRMDMVKVVLVTYWTYGGLCHYSFYFTYDFTTCITFLQIQQIVVQEKSLLWMYELIPSI